MDYRTNPISREDLRRYSKILREIFNVPPTGPFPVLETLDKISDIFKKCNYEIVDNDKMPTKTMARCIPNDQGGYTIEIKELVYLGAYDSQTGAYLGFICHEICHVFLFEIGFKPVAECSFADNELPAYCSVEWQAKALCAETMIPYEESEGMSESSIINVYHVSKAFAAKRRML